ncbi:MAG: large-conductance mechanosensitive channel protein MscL [Minisyncoccia bacterium]
MKSFIQEFKTFALRGNAIDLAIGVVVGAAFNDITNSLVANIITPPLGLLIGGIDFSDLVIPLGGTAALQYGLFLESIIHFVIIAFALFALVKFINRLARRTPQESAPPKKSAELSVLEDIRDSLNRG